MPLAVTLKSIERSQANPSAMTISVFTAGFSAQHEEAVRRSVPELKLEFIDLDRHLPSDLPQMRWFTRATYGRLVAPTLIGRVNRVIYLDADVIVRDDLGFLHAQGLHENVIAAVRSISVPHVSDPFGLSQWEQLGLSATTPFFNSGVLVIDAGAWRRADMTRRVLDFISDNSDHLEFAEQDAMNAVIAGAFQPLPLRWNQESAHRDTANPFHSFLRGYAALPEDEVREAFENPAVTHFTGPVKPWHAQCTDPAAAEWWELLAATTFRKKTSAWNRFASGLRSVRAGGD